jgi:hypothetical protein
MFQYQESGETPDQPERLLRHASDKLAQIDRCVLTSFIPHLPIIIFRVPNLPRSLFLFPEPIP